MGLLEKKTEISSRPGQDLTGVGVLVVDDVPAHRELYREILISVGYSNIHMASTGAECLSILQANVDEIFVVLLDRILPDATAGQIVRQLLNFHHGPVGIVINTAYPSTESRIEFSEVDSEYIYVTAYLDKAHYDIDLISAEVQNAAEIVCEKRSALPAPKVKVAYEPTRAIKLDPSRVESRIRSGVSRLSGKIPGLAASIGLGALRILLLSLLVGVALKLDTIADITTFLAKFID